MVEKENLGGCERKAGWLWRPVGGAPCWLCTVCTPCVLYEPAGADPVHAAHPPLVLPVSRLHARLGGLFQGTFAFYYTSTS